MQSKRDGNRSPRAGGQRREGRCGTAMRLRPVVAGLMWAIALISGPLHAELVPKAELARECQVLRETFWKQLAGNTQIARPLVERICPPQDASRLYLPVAPEYVAAFIPSAAATTATEETPPLARQYAAQLMGFAQQAREADDITLSHQLAHEAFACDRHNQAARQALAWPKSSATRAIRWDLKPPRRSHPRIAWNPRDYRVLQTAHYRISTNDTEENAVALATTLEQLHIAWHQLFYSMSHEGLARRSPRARPPLPHDVVLFRTHDEYVARLRTIEPQIEITRGYYHAPTRTAYFVGGATANRTTWLHEATHQLFHEQPSTNESVGQAANFWMIEGIALYLETLQPWPGGFAVGGLEADRLQTARFRALRESYYIPVHQMAAFNQSTWQHHDRIHALYSQAAGWTHCLMHAQDGSLRSVVPRYLEAIYQQRDQRDSLVEISGKSWTELDQIYREFLNVTDRDLQRLDPHVQPRQLCLGATQVTNAGFKSLQDLSRCTWLDLYGLPITDDATNALERATQLQQLNLERTQITDTTVARLAQAHQLQQLDLSRTRTTDAGILALQTCTQLEALWLTGTFVTDASVTPLRSFTRLKTLDIEATPMTEAAAATLRAAQPELVVEGPAATAPANP